MLVSVFDKFEIQRMLIWLTDLNLVYLFTKHQFYIKNGGFPIGNEEKLNISFQINQTYISKSGTIQISCGVGHKMRDFSLLTCILTYRTYPIFHMMKSVISSLFKLYTSRFNFPLSTDTAPKINVLRCS